VAILTINISEWKRILENKIMKITQLQKLYSMKICTYTYSRYSELFNYAVFDADAINVYISLYVMQK